MKNLSQGNSKREACQESVEVFQGELEELDDVQLAAVVGGEGGTIRLEADFDLNHGDTSSIIKFEAFIKIAGVDIPYPGIE
jgi:hypothetical protein